MLFRGCETVPDSLRLLRLYEKPARQGGLFAIYGAELSLHVADLLTKSGMQIRSRLRAAIGLCSRRKRSQERRS
jgi:hypothetical protein